MSTPLYDAHIHLTAPVLLEHAALIWKHYAEIRLGKVLVVGTSPDDWPSVIKLARSKSQVIPAVGLHPWSVNTAPHDWKEQFLCTVKNGARAIGEIGLDKWIQDHDIDQQQEAFRFQLHIAAERNLPASIHCLRAIGPLMETVRSVELPQRGIHIHAYNGPVELIPELVSLGAYFSFNAGQLKPGKSNVPERIRAVPLERLLIETDAPDFLPPEQFREFDLPNPQLCHPANLRASYRAMAKIRQISYEVLAQEVEANFIRLLE